MTLRGYFDKNLSPHVELNLPQGGSLDVVVDTGFNGELCLPLSLLRKHRFVWRGVRKVELADGSRVDSDLYEGEILWFGKHRKVTALATRSSEGLLGTEMLRGVRLEIDVDDDVVLITQK